MAKTKKSTNLTEGNILKLLIMFALPIMAGQLLQNLYNSVDSIVVGQFAGTTALAAVSSCGDISQLLVGFFVGLSTGAGVLFSRYFGAKDYDRLHLSIHTAICFAIILGFMMAVLGIALTPALLSLTKCPADVIVEAKTYMRIYFVSMFFSSLYNIGAGILRAVGDSHDPFVYLTLSGITNVILDLVFTGWLKMGVAGVAIATVMAQMLSVTLVFRNMLRTDDVYKLSPKELRIDKDILKSILELGLPTALLNVLNSMVHIFNQRYVNAFGSAAMAGHGAGKKIDKFAGLATNALGLALTTFISQNMGAKKPERAFRAMKICVMCCFVVVAAICTPVYFFADTFLGIFTDDPDAVAFGMIMLKTMLPLFSFQAFNQVYSNAVCGFGKPRATMLLSALGIVLVRQIYLIVGMSIYPQPVIIAIAPPVGWFFSGLFCCIYYWRKFRTPYMKSLKNAAR